MGRGVGFREGADDVEGAEEGAEECVGKAEGLRLGEEDVPMLGWAEVVGRDDGESLGANESVGGLDGPPEGQTEGQALSVADGPKDGGALG